MIFGANAKFFGQQPAAENDFLYLLNEKNQNSFSPAR